MEVKFGEEKRVYKAKRRQYRAKHLLPKGNLKVLDLGAGLGEFADHMTQEYGYTVTCVDGNEAFMEKTRARGYESQAVDLENEKLPFEDGSFDGVVSLEVIEHLWNTEHYVSEIKRVTKSEGWVIISTPNYDFWKCRLQHLVGRFFDQDLSTRHKRFFTFRSLVTSLTLLGLIKDDYIVIGYLPFVPKNIPTKILPNIFGATSMVKCRIEK